MRGFVVFSVEAASAASSGDDESEFCDYASSALPVPGRIGKRPEASGALLPL